jgi:hypothetical protein
MQLREDPLADIAWYTADHYWSNFHRRSILFLIPVGPDRSQLELGRIELNLIANALEGDWAPSVLETKLYEV